jgi:hypothetical protein
MTITQTVEVPPSRRITVDIPPEFPSGKVILTFAPAVPPEDEAEARDIELINRNAERLNREALDVLSFQSLEI